MTDLLAIYVLPSIEHMPPQAAIGKPVTTEEGTGIEGTVATWSSDTGTWTFPSGTPVPPDLAEAITEHARNLGVEW